MAIKNEYLKKVFAQVQSRDKNEPEFLQAVEEVLESLESVVVKEDEEGEAIVAEEKPVVIAAAAETA